MIQQDNYHLPFTGDIVSVKAACDRLCTVDLRYAFHDVDLYPESRRVTKI